jgi:hypothetical protein
MMESEVMGNYHASFGERDGETRTVRIVKVRTVPTPLTPRTQRKPFVKWNHMFYHQAFIHAIHEDLFNQ